MKFGLENIATLCEALGHPERAFRSIVIGGTNGKGSATVMTETALRSAGHRTARYTSPHLVRLEERFVVDGRVVETEVLREVVGVVQGVVESLVQRGILEAPPTFFECTTAAAFELFRRSQVDVAVLEVGLGGRLDATNIVMPIATAITSIDFDHQAQLGNTIEAIAREKAGIIKAGVPVICGRVPEAADAVFREVSAARGARLVRAPDVVEVRARGDGTVGIHSRLRSIDGLTLALAGRHQHDNASVAVALLDELVGLGLQVSDDDVRYGLTRAEWPGRLERFARDGIEILLDAAHNPAGARALASHLQEVGWSGVTLLFGAMRDKDVGPMLEALAPACASIVCTTAPSPRAWPADDLAATARAFNPAVESVADPAAALARAVSLGRPVVAAGSIFLIGPLRDILR